MQMRKANPAAQLPVNRREALATIFGAIGATISSLAHAQAPAWPSRPVRIITHGAPGSAPDLAARIWSEKLSARWKQPVLIDNKPGGDGIIAVQAMLAARDGHSLFFGPHFIYTVLHNTNQDIAIKPRDEMVPICATNLDFIGIAASPKVPVTSLAELRDYSRTRPDTLNWWAPQGSALWLLMKDFIDKASLRTLYVPYRNGPQATADLLQDRLHVVMAPLAQLVGHVGAGSVKLIATAGTRRPPAAPGVQTVTEQGFPEMTIEGVFGFYGPKDISVRLIEQISADVGAAAIEPDLGTRFERLGQSLRTVPTAEFAGDLDGFERKLPSSPADTNTSRNEAEAVEPGSRIFLTAQ
ncbi:MAG: tripartite tricarboxylate transporter substrate binding protein [Sphingomonadales bacterium]|nr:tripartite tricarboxylate transporter substrate binding protein [Sphingomonadales bacterium]